MGEQDAGATASHLQRTPSWAGVRAGDAVRVDGVRYRSASWTFVAHVRNTRTGDEWVEVAGGRPGSHSLRSFRLEQILPAGPVRGAKGLPTGAPLAVAPRLPL